MLAWLAGARRAMTDAVFEEAESPEVLPKLRTIDETRAILKTTAHPQYETHERKIVDETIYSRIE